jgi:hypothetical protein
MPARAFEMLQTLVTGARIDHSLVRHQMARHASMPVESPGRIIAPGRRGLQARDRTPDRLSDDLPHGPVLLNQCGRSFSLLNEQNISLLPLAKPSE